MTGQGEWSGAKCGKMPNFCGWSGQTDRAGYKIICVSRERYGSHIPSSLIVLCIIPPDRADHTDQKRRRADFSVSRPPPVVSVVKVKCAAVRDGTYGDQPPRHFKQIVIVPPQVKGERE